jgi:hypothetical protein
VAGLAATAGGLFDSVAVFEAAVFVGDVDGFVGDPGRLFSASLSAWPDAVLSVEIVALRRPAGLVATEGFLPSPFVNPLTPAFDPTPAFTASAGDVVDSSPEFRRAGAPGGLRFSYFETISVMLPFRTCVDLCSIGAVPGSLGDKTAEGDGMNID